MSHAIKRKLCYALSAIGTFGLVISGSAAMIAVALLPFAAMSALQAFILWIVWNLTAPLLDFIPQAYKSIDFLPVWGVVVIVWIVSRVLFGARMSIRVVKKGE